MFCKFHRENPKNLQRHRVRAIEKRRGSPNAYIARMPYMQKANYEELLQMLPHNWKERNKE